MSAPARAAEAVSPFDEAHFCRPKELLRQSRGLSCQENDRLSLEAEACLEKFLSYLDQKKNALQAAMEALLRDRLERNSAHNQSGDFANSSLDYRQADLTYAHLRDVGEHSREEIRIYRRSLRIAFHWPRGEPFPDPDDPAWEAYFSSDACYGDHNLRIRAALAGVEKALRELAGAQAENARLGSFSERRLAEIQNLSAGRAAGTTGAGAGGSAAGRSDVTGLVEDRRKRRQLSGAPESGQIPGADAGFSRVLTKAGGAPKRGAFDTGRSSASSLRFRMDLGNSFSSRGNLFNASGTGEAPDGPAPSGPPESVGGVVWRLSENAGKSGLELAVDREKGSLPDGSGGQSSAGAPPVAPGTNAEQSAPEVLVTREGSLFHAVSLRYRRTELFRSR